MWPGGYGQASYILQSCFETPQHDRIVDFACGCGVGAVAALRTKIPHVLAIDICPYATMSTLMNVQLNFAEEEVAERLSLLTKDIIGTKVGEVIQNGDLVYCGDVLYDDAFASSLLPWLQELASEGIDVIVSDPGRWVLLEMSKSDRSALLQPIETVVFEKWFSSQNHGLISSNLYKILPPPHV